MHEYIKINTVQKRDEKSKKIILDTFSKPHFENIKIWRATEKIDGTNIRIDCGVGSGFEIKGKTDNANLHPALIDGIFNLFPDASIFDEVFPTASKVILYGEGYGPKINGGGKYRKDHSFILFDILIDSKWWLDYENIKDVAEKLNIDVVPTLGFMTIDDAISFVQTSPKSLIADCTMEGLVLVPDPVMLFNNGTPIKVKVKVKDYLALKTG